MEELFWLTVGDDNVSVSTHIILRFILRIPWGLVLYVTYVVSIMTIGRDNTITYTDSFGRSFYCRHPNS